MASSQISLSSSSTHRLGWVTGGYLFLLLYFPYPVFVGILPATESYFERVCQRSTPKTEKKKVPFVASCFGNDGELFL